MNVFRNGARATALAALFTATASQAAVIQTVSGVSSAGVPFEFEAQLAIAGNSLTITLSNNSTVHSQNPNDLLSSFYFDIVNGSNARPTLTYTAATGNTWLGNSAGPDVVQQVGANLVALAANDNTWQFRTMSAASSPFLGFGIGTVGNNGLTPNNFQGSIVGNLDYSIYAGDVTTANLNNRVLVLETATFTFTGVAGFTEADISVNSVFGLGTAPDSLVHAPAPAASVLLALGGAFAIRRRNHR